MPPAKDEPRLTHIDAEGSAAMVDVSEKDVTERIATAAGTVFVQAGTMALIRDGLVKKGDVLSVARLAGIMGAKRTADLIPLCHPLNVNSIKVDLTLADDRDTIEIVATVRVSGRTGVEMEAMTAVTVAALTVYDMVKAVDRTVVIGDVRLLHKEGGRSGIWDADEAARS